MRICAVDQTKDIYVGEEWGIWGVEERRIQGVQERVLM